MSERDTICIILAAGQGTRMKSDLAKVLHCLEGRPIVCYVVECALKAGLKRSVVVVGYQKEKVMEALRDYPVQFAVQMEQNGTGHAVQMALATIPERSGSVVVLAGDAPFLRPSTLRAFVSQHASSGCDCTVLTAVVPDAHGYGRIARDSAGNVTAIIEHDDCTETERRIREVNSGMYCFRLPSLISCARLLTDDNVQGELYLTDVVSIMRSKGMKLGTFTAPDWREMLGINTVEQLAQGGAILRALREET
jgi:bifunctional UDP-N-acetylglucosamine pyrophosphorylase/glucosamine-1-phosphate N-acetyltransferase